MNISEINNASAFSSESDLLLSEVVLRERQLEASEETLRYVASEYRVPENLVFFDAMIDILYFARRSKECLANEDICQALLASTVSLFDVFLFDEICDRTKKQTPFGVGYGRGGFSDVNNIRFSSVHNTKHENRLLKFIPHESNFFYKKEIEVFFERIKAQQDTEDFVAYVRSKAEMRRALRASKSLVNERNPKKPKLVCDKAITPTELEEMCLFVTQHNMRIQKKYRGQYKEKDTNLLSFIYREDISENLSSLSLYGYYDEIVSMLLSPITQIDIQTVSELLL